MNAFVSVCVCVFVCAGSVCMRMYTYVCVFVYLGSAGSVCMHDVDTYVDIHIDTYVYTYICAYIRVCVYTYARMCTHKYMYAYVCILSVCYSSRNPFRLTGYVSCPIFPLFSGYGSSKTWISKARTGSPSQNSVSCSKSQLPWLAAHQGIYAFDMWQVNAEGKNWQPKPKASLFFDVTAPVDGHLYGFVNVTK